MFRATRMRVNPRQRAAHALFKTYLDVVHVDKEEGDKLFKQRTGAEVSLSVGVSVWLSGCLLYAVSKLRRQQRCAQITRRAWVTLRRPGVSCCCCCCVACLQSQEGVEPTQTQGGPDVLFSSNITRQQLLEKEEQFKVGSSS